MMQTQQTFLATEEYARTLDAEDPLAGYREQFHIPIAPNGQKSIYFCGNSLGPLPINTFADIEQLIDQWKILGVRGHFIGERPWMSYDQFIREAMAQVVGGLVDEIVMMGTLTNNIHTMLVAFYKPEGPRQKILGIEGGFPSDRYALHTMLALRGRDPEDLLLTIGPREGEHLIRTEDIENILKKNGGEIALVFLPGVHFATGQCLDMKRITKAAHDQGCLVGFDLAHAAGNVPLHLHEWEVDFAVWCGYKYLSAGPGHGAGCFVHEIHATDPNLLHLGGWWGNDPNSRFEMRQEFEPILTAERFHVSNPATLSLTPLHASLQIFIDAGVENIWAKSRRLTAFLEFLLDHLPDQPFEIITPRDPTARGNQLSVLLEHDAKEIADGLLARGVILDERPPNLIRVAPTPLYNTYHEAWRFVQIFQELIS